MHDSRRDFLKNSALVLAGYGLATGIPIDTLASIRNRISPNDKIRMGAIGVNGMGWSDVNAMLKNNADVVCVALCDVDENVLNKRAAELEKTFNMKATLYPDYRKLLDNKDIDVVIIVTPDHWH